MRFDSANRSFFTLLGVALAPYLLLGLLGCGVLSLAVYRLATDGPDAVAAEPTALAALAFLVVVATGTVLGLRSVWHQARASLSLMRTVSATRVAPEAPVLAVARRAGVPRLEVVQDDSPYSFTYGILSPRVVVSTGLVTRLDDRELEAVLAHERYHLRNLDPLKVVIARALPSAFFFLPALRHLQRRYLAGRELAADRTAVRACGREPLAGALYKVVAGPARTTLGAAAAIGGTELLEVRLAQLEDGREPPLAPVPRAALVGTGFGLAVTAAGAAATVALGYSTSLGPTTTAGTGPLDVAGGAACVVLWTAAALVLYGRFSPGRMQRRRRLARSTTHP